MKRVFPIIWLGFVGIGLVVSGVAFFSNKGGHGQLPPAPFTLIPVLMLIFGFVLFRKLLWDLADSVDDGRDYLLVRRGSIEERVALSNVLNVSMTQFTNPPRLTLRLRKPGQLGDEIVFIPKSQGLRLNPFRRNEIAESLIRRVDQARNSGDTKR
ncbi:MAG: hypothetical protein ACREPT_10510 [Rudaea sp.]